MKKTLCILLSLILALTGLAGLVVPAIAAYGPGLGTSGQIGDNVYYTFDRSAGAAAITGTGDTWDFKCDVDDGDDDSPFYYGCLDVKSITINEGVTSIGNRLFTGTRITEIKIPDSVAKIGNEAFSETCLKSVTIPNSVTSIGEYAFDCCYYLETAVIPGSVKTIPSMCFQNCSKLKDVCIGKGVEKVGSSAFNFSPESPINVYYSGSAADWAGITILRSNDALLNANIFYNTPVPVRLVPDNTQVRPGDTVTYTVKIGPVTDMVGADIWLELPDGLTVDEYDLSAEYAASNPDATLQFSSAQSHFIIYSIYQTPYTTAAETDLMTFTCTVGSDASGEMLIELPKCELAVSSHHSIPCAYDPAGSAVTVVTSSSAYKTGDLVEFGSYPQTRVTDDATIDALNKVSATWQSYDYYMGSGGDYWDGQMTASDYMQYCDVTLGTRKYRGVRFSQYRPYRTGNIASEQTTYQDDNGYTTNTTY